MQFCIACRLISSENGPLSCRSGALSGRRNDDNYNPVQPQSSLFESVMTFRDIPLSMPETVCMIGPTKPLFWTLNTLGQPVPRDLPHRSASWRRHQPSGGKDDSWVYTLRLAWHGQQRFRRTNFNSPRRVIAWNRPSRNELVNCTWFALNMS